MSKPTKARCPDYQKFSFDADGNVSGPGERMAKKLKAIPLPDLRGLSVLDVGCDFGFWSFLAANKGASLVVGLDRGRPIDGKYFDLITSNREVAAQYPNFRNVFFEPINIGKQWLEYGSFDVIFLFSLYHHIFENCGDHEVIWFWLFNQCAADGVIVWENPVDVDDGVAYSNISKDKHHLYTVDKIMFAAEKYFDAQYIGPALHEPTRHVYYFRPKAIPRDLPFAGKAFDGAGGAAIAFQYAEFRRGREIAKILGFMPFPGSLNVRLDRAFGWDHGFYSGKILDVVTRSKGFHSEWHPRPVRFYPVKVNGIRAFAMRFEGEDGEGYPDHFVELIADVRLRDTIIDGKVTLERA